MQKSVCIWVFDQSLLSAKADSSKNSFSNIGNSIHQIRVGHWVLVSHYNFDISAAQIIQIGVVTEIDVETEKFVLDMTSTDLLITPGPNGKRHWQKPYFSLVPKRAYAYEIPKRFAESFNKQDWSDIKVVQPSRINTGSRRLPSLHEEEGYVYIWQWENEFKIGKAFDVEGRMERVSRETGRDIIEIHRIFSSDYSRAEALLHNHFQEKRLYGEAGIEWFLLDPEDVEWLKSITVFEDIEDEIS